MCCSAAVTSSYAVLPLHQVMQCCGFAVLLLDNSTAQLQHSSTATLEQYFQSF
jgi:hypothetical protein